MPSSTALAPTTGSDGHSRPPGQVVLVLQGGGALGAYQWGVVEALQAAGIEPDWVIGTSIGAINAALVAGNAPSQRLQRLALFWQTVQQRAGAGLPLALQAQGWGGLWANLATLGQGIPGFFQPSAAAWAGPLAAVGIEQAAWYDTSPLRHTLAGLVDPDRLAGQAPGSMRLTVGAVNARSGAMRYFDSRDAPLGLDHILASGALPPAFGAVRIDGEPYWDGGIYSNTPIEAVLDDRPRRSSLIFAVNLWQPAGPEPVSIWQVASRQKDIQYASRADSHLARQKQIHHLRRVIRALASHLSPAARADAEVQALTAWGCGTTMHVAHLEAPRLDGEDANKDIDFSPAGVLARHAAGLADTRRMLALAPWQAPVDPLEGVVEHRC